MCTINWHIPHLHREKLSQLEGSSSYPGFTWFPWRPAILRFIHFFTKRGELFTWGKNVGSSSRLGSFIVFLFSPFFCNLGDIGCILYNDADHYWSFDQSQIPQIADQRNGTEITLHGSPESKDSPTSKSLYLTDTTSVDLIEVTESSCLFDPSDCPTGFSITMFIKYRPRGSNSVDGFQMFFGNNDGIELNQGISIYYNENTKHKAVNVTVFGSSDYCFRTFGKYSSSIIVFII